MSYKEKREVTIFRCLRCRYEWQPRNADKEPQVCPHCHSPYWRTPRKRDRLGK